MPSFSRQYIAAGSVDGVLRVAQAFDALGDREVVQMCLRVASRGGRDRDTARGRTFAERIIR
jgi:hypothetical protein